MMPWMIGITGPSASGKSLLSEAVRAVKPNTVVVQQDWYFRDSTECPPDANFCESRWLHVDDLVRTVSALASGQPAEVPVIEFATFRQTGTAQLAPAPAVIIEGMTILRIPEVDRHLNARFYIDVDMATVAARKRTRDCAERGKTLDIIDAQLRWIEDEYRADTKLRQRADVRVLSRDSDLSSRVRSILDRTLDNPPPRLT